MSESTATPDIEALLDNAACASQVRELLRDDEGEETVLREAVRMNVVEPLLKVIRSATPSIDERRDLLRLICPGNGDDPDPVRCQSYEASEQSQPCPPGCCVMADAGDVRAVLKAIERENGETQSATAPRANPIPLIKRLREQRDDVADMLREIVEDDFLAAYPAVEARAGALLKTIPTAEQQLRNIAEGIGMPYDDLIAALNDRADSRNKNG